jgi:tetraprenyl-beta-curcumene synthase
MARVSQSLSLLLLAMLTRYWLTIWPMARHALRGWQARAERIPDAELRRLALATHTDERMNAEGAAIFATLAPWRMTPALVRVLVAYQVLFDYLDSITETRTPAHEDARQLHRALTDALDPATKPADWYALHPSREDGGYLAALVLACRAGVRRLPAYEQVALAARRLAQRSGEVQALNHDVTPMRADYLRAWAVTYPELASGLRWWEFAASASSSLGVHALLALASDPRTTREQADHVEQTYCVSLGALNTLLESLVDLPRDSLTGAHSFASYYGSPKAAAARLSVIAKRARAATDALPQGARHAIILAGMVGFYLSAPEAWQAHAKPASTVTLAAIGPPTPTLVRVLRVRRSL